MNEATSTSTGSAWRVCLLFLGYGLLHSLLASSWSKNLVERLGGQRVRHGLYRPFFIVQSVVTTVWAFRQFLKLPDRTLYQVPQPWSWLWRAVQVFAVTLLLRALAVVGYLRLLGVPPLVAFLRGRQPEATPEAQDHRRTPTVSRRRLAPSGSFAIPTTFSLRCLSGRCHA